MGEAIPGKEIMACGYTINGITTCKIAWLRGSEDGSMNYIEGASEPTYWVTENDVNSYLAVEVLPIDSKGRKGEVLKVYANEKTKITHEDGPLPAVQGLQIIGEAIPGKEVMAGGYTINGTTTCKFAWLRGSEDGSMKYIEGASEPNYWVTEDDVNSCLAVEVLPIDSKGRKGEVVKVYANEKTKITHGSSSESLCQ
ncbi:uncharacterized protein LOC132294984 [Cornus florida]|uniref:uncharacterized protein LOC132294984 n=1 Tax=Cornus florida TaxID=4283 RepID=UPI00289E993C|nr:uncharacterized protein LOC132294984 [Cornus florida]XP_059649028.1 uncharacterized protein LOC132294984 [Cornus florida]XP_059649029.1 uncharacterized protein LOC132294984 [Cornus florida]